MNNVQTILIVVVVALTTLLIVVGVQVILIIMDIRKALKRLNTILDDSILGGGLIRPDKLTGLFEMLRKKKSVETHGSSEDFHKL